MGQTIKYASKMRIIKPTQDEKTIITILIATSFGLIIGVWAMLEKVNEVEAENDYLLYPLHCNYKPNVILLPIRHKIYINCRLEDFLQ